MIFNVQIANTTSPNTRIGCFFPRAPYEHFDSPEHRATLESTIATRDTHTQLAHNNCSLTCPRIIKFRAGKPECDLKQCPMSRLVVTQQSHGNHMAYRARVLAGMATAVTAVTAAAAVTASHCSRRAPTKISNAKLILVSSTPSRPSRANADLGRAAPFRVGDGLRVCGVTCAGHYVITMGLRARARAAGLRGSAVGGQSRRMLRV